MKEMRRRREAITQNGELANLYCSYNAVKMNKQTKMGLMCCLVTLPVVKITQRRKMGFE
jgi:hypothetical protein